MRQSSPIFLALALGLVAGCSTSRLSLAPIDHPTEVPLEYRTGWERGALDAATAVGAAPASPSERVQADFVRLSIEESEALFGPIGTRPAALEVALADVERMLAAIVEQNVSRLQDAGLVALAPGSDGELRAVKQCAYIAAFELEQVPGAAIADPVVQLAEEGYRLRLAARAPLDSASFEIAVELVLGDLDRPMRERTIELPGSRLPVTVHEPSCLTRRIQTTGRLSDSHALLLAGIPARESGETLLLVLRREKR